MTTYSDQDLESMLFDLESDLAERKESLPDAPRPGSTQAYVLPQARRRSDRQSREGRSGLLSGLPHPRRRGRRTSWCDAAVTLKKKLIGVALPLDAINKASAREKSLRHGHPSTLPLWWARRPLAAAR